MVRTDEPRSCLLCLFEASPRNFLFELPTVLTLLPLLRVVCSQPGRANLRLSLRSPRVHIRPPDRPAALVRQLLQSGHLHGKEGGAALLVYVCVPQLRVCASLFLFRSLSAQTAPLARMLAVLSVHERTLCSDAMYRTFTACAFLGRPAMAAIPGVSERVLASLPCPIMP